MLRETTSRGLCGLVCPSRTSDAGEREIVKLCVCFITAGPIIKLCAWGEEESGGHVL